MKLLLISFLILFFQSSYSATSKKLNSQNKLQNIEKELKIRGQSRTISMLLVIKNKKETLDFIKVKDNYKQEIIKTLY